MGNNIKDIQQIKSLIAKGKEMGFLTFEAVSYTHLKLPTNSRV